MGMVYIGDLQGALGGQEIERAYRESLLGGGKRVSDTGASITYGLTVEWWGLGQESLESTPVGDYQKEKHISIRFIIFRSA